MGSISWFTILLFLVSVPGLCKDKLELIYPKPFTIITKNTVRLLAKVNDPAISEIKFFIQYKPSVDSFQLLTSGTVVRYLGLTKVPAVEYIADIGDIADQDEKTLNFFIKGFDKKGDPVAEAGKEERFLVLDRKSGLSEKTYLAHFKNKLPNIDGIIGPDEWKGSDTLLFYNGPNIIKCFSVWNNNYLGLVIHVMDDNIVGDCSAKGYQQQNLDPAYHPVSPDFVPIPAYDEIEIFFDTKNNHNIMRNMDDVHLLVGARGAWYGRAYDRKQKKSELWGKTIEAAVRENESPSGYTIELAMPWKELNVNPADGLRMGFDIYNKNYHELHGKSSGISWNGNEWTNYNNPSEWGDILLVRKRDTAGILLKSGIAILGFLLVMLLALRMIRKRQESQLGQKNRMLGDRLDQYIQDNYHDADLNLQKAADNMGLHPKYAGTIFKRVKKITFSQRLISYRIEKASNLLKNESVSITDIAFKVGFNSASHFSKVFKDLKKVTPAEFRKET